MTRLRPALLALSFTTLASAQSPLSWDQRLMRDLRASGDVERRPRLTIWFDPGALPPSDRAELADLADRGIRHLEKFLGPPRPWQRWPRPNIEYFVSSRVAVSRMNAELGPVVFLSLTRVRSKDAPYLHETVHVLTTPAVTTPPQDSYPQNSNPMWREEGFASFVADEVVRRSGGWRFTFMTRGGNATVHRECAELLADPQVASIDPFIGQTGRPSGRDLWSRAAPGGVAPMRRAMYVCGQSYVKFLVDRYGLKSTFRLFSQPDPIEGQRIVFGKPVDRLRQDWHAALRTARS